MFNTAYLSQQYQFHIFTLQQSFPDSPVGGHGTADDGLEAFGEVLYVCEAGLFRYRADEKIGRPQKPAHLVHLRLPDSPAICNATITDFISHADFSVQRF